MMLGRGDLVLGLVIFFAVLFIISGNSSSNNGASSNKCFCKLEGDIDDCSCKIEIVNEFNNLKIFPRLNSLLHKDFFRYLKLNLKRTCPFWPDDSRCSLKDCHVEQCHEVPAQIKGYSESNRVKHEKNKYAASENTQKKDCDDELGSLDVTISAENQQQFKTWTEHDEAKHNFCEIDDETSSDSDYVDLLRNPERYTGYIGSSPQRIWTSIYEENCFKPHPGYGYTLGLCLEKRVFYRLVSGLHSSINIHLCAQYLLGKGPFDKQKWGPNVEEFKRRFDPERTDGEGPLRLKNLYFTYLVELRALAKAAPYLEKELYYTGSNAVDQDTKDAVKQFLDTVRSFKDQFDESQLFKGQEMEMIKLKEEFRNHFLNISRIMDCVGCDKCKLWGKLQIMGMGTALKILFSGEDFTSHSNKDENPKFSIQLRRPEIVSLFNAFGRLSRSLKELEIFHQKLSSGR